MKWVSSVFLQCAMLHCAQRGNVELTCFLLSFFQGSSIPTKKKKKWKWKTGFSTRREGGGTVNCITMRMVVGTKRTGNTTMGAKKRQTIQHLTCTHVMSKVQLYMTFMYFEYYVLYNLQPTTYNHNSTCTTTRTSKKGNYVNTDCVNIAVTSMMFMNYQTFHVVSNLLSIVPPTILEILDTNGQS